MKDTLRRVLAPIASLKLTVALLAMSMFLVFAGTWAQLDRGIWTVLEQYFRTWWTVIPLGIFLPRDWNVHGAIPFPGGWTIGGLMLVNLLAAHTIRFRWTKDRIGIFLIHFSLIMLLVGEFATGLFAVESRMTIDEGQTVNYAEDVRSVELAIVDVTDPSQNRVIAIPQRALEHKKTISHPDLPFTIQVDRFLPNADLVSDENAGPSALHGNRGAAVSAGVAALPKAVARGVGRDEADMPVAQITLKDGVTDLGTYLTALWFTFMPSRGTQIVDVGGHRYELWLRFVRHYKPYSMQLVDFKHDKYLGTETPKNFSSLVRLIDPEKNLDHEVLIWMNNPLRHRGETFYQASFKKGDMGTVLQVVRNPAWLLPYVACTIGALGMSIHFGQNLLRFLRRQRKTAAHAAHPHPAREPGRPAVAGAGAPHAARRVR
ncbi:MAG: cytochrome c biogenesis protein ResB [Gemmatimonadetes bacterium]|nr:cytochrome c biogenesis protein ResB [Gemmatimonadota bacterium]